MSRSVPLLVVLALAAPSAAFAAPDLLGAEKCGTCHEAEYKQWLTTGHASALARLSSVQQRDATCRSCHTTAPDNPDPAFAGVQCESCHGPGKMYAPRHVMKDKELAKLLGLEAVTEEVCGTCHAKDTPSVRDFVFAEKIALVRHKPGQPPAEPEKKATP